MRCRRIAMTGEQFLRHMVTRSNSPNGDPSLIIRNPNISPRTVAKGESLQYQIQCLGCWRFVDGRDINLETLPSE